MSETSLLLMLRHLGLEQAHPSYRENIPPGLRERQIPYDIAYMWNLIKGSLGLKEDPTSQSNPEYSLEGLMLKLKLQNWPPVLKS